MIEPTNSTSLLAHISVLLAINEIIYAFDADLPTYYYNNNKYNQLNI